MKRNNINKKKEVNDQINKLLNDMKIILSKDLDKVISSGALPDNYLEQGNWFLSKFLIHNRISNHLVPWNPQTKREWDNLSKFV